ncbi:MAG: 4'-phosphopantetheinyl transferase superfamily protein [Candidatus Sulfotelmatobacter sp.]
MNIYWLEHAEPDVPTTNEWLNPNEAIRLGGLHFAKRRADWRLGRWTAKHAVAACLDLPTDLPALANLEIRAASSGAPEVFLDDQALDLAISLSHSAGTALCTVAPAATTFGCDLETIEPHSAAFVADYFTDAEGALIHQTSVEARPLLLALLWSGKESALKALRLGLRLDTRCMCVSFDDHLLLLTANPDGWRPLRVRYSGTPMFEGWWRVQDRSVRTIVSNCPHTPVSARPASAIDEMESCSA